MDYKKNSKKRVFNKKYIAKPNYLSLFECIINGIPIKLYPESVATFIKNEKGNYCVFTDKNGKELWICNEIYAMANFTFKTKK